MPIVGSLEFRKHNLRVFELEDLLSSQSSAAACSQSDSKRS